MTVVGGLNLQGQNTHSNFAKGAKSGLGTRGGLDSLWKKQRLAELCSAWTGPFDFAQGRLQPVPTWFVVSAGCQ